MIGIGLLTSDFRAAPHRDLTGMPRNKYPLLSMHTGPSSNISELLSSDLKSCMQRHAGVRFAETLSENVKRDVPLVAGTGVPPCRDESGAAPRSEFLAVRQASGLKLFSGLLIKHHGGRKDRTEQTATTDFIDSGDGRSRRNRNTTVGAVHSAGHRC